MAFVDQMPHWFLAVIAIVVLVFIIKSLIKIALIVGAIGLVIYLAWTLHLFDRIRGGLIPGFA
jgi:hypothetical protein